MRFLCKTYQLFANVSDFFEQNKCAKYYTTLRGVIKLQ